MSKCDMDLAKVLFEHHPKLLDCDVTESAHAAVEVSRLLGCILAVVLLKQPHQFEAATTTCFEAAIDSVTKVAEKAIARMAAGEPMTLQ